MSGPRRASRRRRPLRWIIGAVVVLALIVVGGPFVYIHFIEGPAPKPLALPKTSTHGAAPAGFPTGVWHVTPASQVGYRVDEVLFGQNNVAVGRTHSVTGSLTLADAQVTTGAFTVKMATVHSDESQRDNQFDGRIMDVATYPTAAFTLTSPITLNASTKAGVTVSATATGNLTLRGQTHAVTFPVKARYSASAIDINGTIPITFATWAIPNPSFAGSITVQNHGLLEFLLILGPGS
jgi:polyisoprenoid-binding protein YceI